MPSFKVALVAGGREPPKWVEDALAKQGIKFVVQQCTTKDELARIAGDAHVVWVYGRDKILTEENLEVIPSCGGIIRTGSGTDNVPVAQATERGIVIVNTPSASAEEVSDHVLALFFALVRQVASQDRLMRNGTWNAAAALPYWRIRKKTLGLIGFGHTARCLVQKMRGFEPTILVFDPYVSPDVIADYQAQAVSLNDVLSQSDWISIHCPLTSDTYHLIGESELRMLKNTAILINTARGAIVDESALRRALQERWILAAGLDVFEEEPLAKDVFEKPLSIESPLKSLDNVLMTPHVAGYSDEYRHHAFALSVESAIAFARGYWPDGVVNPDVKPRWHLNYAPHSSPSLEKL
jgi:D-3-phosphoglycerate dehydrogenase